jgi:hypothetical protein
MYEYTDLYGNLITVDEMNWLEDGLDVNGDPCSRYDIGNEESVWLEDGQEAEVD